jgi:hypothetical protein
MAQQDMPLTTFLIALMKADPATLANANIDKLAARYGVRPQDVSGYLGLVVNKVTTPA